MFHFMFVHYTFSSVWVAEWPAFGKYVSARLAVLIEFCLFVIFIYFPFWFLERDLLLIAPVPVHCFSITFTAPTSTSVFEVVQNI